MLIIPYYNGDRTKGLPVVPRKAVAEVSSIGNYRRGACCVNGWQNESTAGPKGSWSCSGWSRCSGHVTHNCWM